MTATRTIQRCVYLIVALVLSVAGAACFAQGFPNKPLHLIVTYPPGGGSDVLGRTLAAKLTDLLGQPVVVENRAGANGNIGTEYVAKSPPDGYTLLLGNTGPLCISPAIYPKLPYNSATDLVPISLIASTPIILVVNPSLPVKNLQDLIALAKEKPGQLQFASSGSGATSHLAGEMLKQMAGIDIVHVPYKGVAPALTDVLAGHVPMQFIDVSVVVNHIKEGRLRPIAWVGAKRGPAFPDLPTIAESGYAGFDVTGWYGILTAAGTPKDVVSKLHSAVTKAVEAPDVKERFEKLGSIPVTDTPEEFAAYIREELAKWAKVAKAANIRVD